jgi:hypothetical protein
MQAIRLPCVLKNTSRAAGVVNTNDDLLQVRASSGE